MIVYGYINIPGIVELVSLELTVISLLVRMTLTGDDVSRIRATYYINLWVNLNKLDISSGVNWYWSSATLY